MGASLIRHAWAWIVFVWFGCCLPAAAAQFVELTAEIEVNDWSYWFWWDRNIKRPGENGASLFPKGSWPIRCVIGTNSWMMEGPFASNARVTVWFSGTNIVKRYEITSALPEEKLVRRPGFPVVKSPAVGSVTTEVTESEDGNPGRPVRVIDVLGTAEKVCWLAFCSAPVVRGKDPKIPLPNDFWKEFFPASAKFTNTVAQFEDGLGLPRSVDVSTAKGLVLQYQVHHATNVLGWNFPTEFYLVQYKPAPAPWTNSWEVHLMGKGRVTAIGPGAELKVPEK